MKTFATLAVPGTYTAAGDVLVGRTVANAQFLKALVQHSSFEEITLVIGESGDLPALEALTAGWRAPDGRMVIHHVLQLPHLLASGGIDVLHHASHLERLLDLVALRDRYATRTVPVTGQIHSLSYPRLFQDLARGAFIQPSPSDAIFCSSTQGKVALERQLAAIARGSTTPSTWSLPVVPLGVDLDAHRGGDRRASRKALSIPDDAVVLLGLARFTEYDKVDLFPLLQVVERLVHGAKQNVYVVLAGARQGTKTPEMLQLWARVLGIEERVRLKVDFRDDEKRHLLAAGDVFVSPIDNLQETFGQSVIEAMAAGLPVVVSDFDGYKDTVDEQVGARVTTRLGVDWAELSDLAPLMYERPLHLLLGQSIEVDLASLERALLELVRDAAKRERLGKAASARASERYAWPKVIASYEREWKTLSGAPKHGPRARHPLRLDLEDAFGHFPTERIAPSRRVIRSAFSRTAGTPWVIYPELSSLLVDDDVRALLSQAEKPTTVTELTAFAAAHLGERPQWVAGFMVTWLLKHGLLQDA